MGFHLIWLYGALLLGFAGVAVSSQSLEDHSLPPGRWLPGVSEANGLARIPVDVFKAIGRYSQNTIGLRGTCRALRDIDYGVEYVLTLPRDFRDMALLNGLPLDKVTLLNLYHFSDKHIEEMGILKNSIPDDNNLLTFIEYDARDLRAANYQRLIQRFVNLQVVVLPDRFCTEDVTRLYHFKIVRS